MCRPSHSSCSAAYCGFMPARIHRLSRPDRQKVRPRECGRTAPTPAYPVGVSDTVTRVCSTCGHCPPPMTTRTEPTSYGRKPARVARITYTPGRSYAPVKLHDTSNSRSEYVPSTAVTFASQIGCPVAALVTATPRPAAACAVHATVRSAPQVATHAASSINSTLVFICPSAPPSPTGHGGMVSKDLTNYGDVMVSTALRAGLE
jgi:hypothetical protein